MKFNDSAPIYLQIIEDIKSKIVSGHYTSGQRIESVRDMAMGYGVNPNTIQKALSECESQGLLYNQGPSGRFISEDEALIKQLKEDQIQLIVKQCVETMSRYGLSIDEMIALISKVKVKEENNG